MQRPDLRFCPELISEGWLLGAGWASGDLAPPGGGSFAVGAPESCRAQAPSGGCRRQAPGLSPSSEGPSRCLPWVVSSAPRGAVGGAPPVSHGGREASCVDSWFRPGAARGDRARGFPAGAPPQETGVWLRQGKPGTRDGAPGPAASAGQREGQAAHPGGQRAVPAPAALPAPLPQNGQGGRQWGLRGCPGRGPLSRLSPVGCVASVNGQAELRRPGPLCGGQPCSLPWTDPPPSWGSVSCQAWGRTGGPPSSWMRVSPPPASEHTDHSTVVTGL